MNGYANSWEHYADELQWLDLKVQLLLQMQAEAGLDDTSPVDPFKGLIVSEQEVFKLLQEQETDYSSAEVTELLQDMQELQTNIMERVRLSEQAGVFLPLSYLADVFQLSPFEQKCLLIALAVELDRKYEKLYAFAQDDVTCKYPTVDLALMFLCRTPQERLEARAAFAPNGKLFTYFFKSDVEQDRKHSLLSTPLLLDERMIRFLMHNTQVDESIERMIEVWNPSDELPPLLWEEAIQAQMRAFVEKQERDEKIVFLIKGSPGSGKKLHVRQVSRHLQKSLVLVDLAAMVQEKQDGKMLFDRVVREAILHEAVLCFHHVHVLLEDDQAAKWTPLLLDSVRKFPGHVFLLSEKPWRSIELSRTGTFIELALQVPHDRVRQQVWAQLAEKHDVDESVDWSVMAGKFRFTVGQMERTLAVAQNLAMWQSPPREAIDLDTMHQACYSQIQHGLEKKATRIKPKANWNSLVLPAEQKEQLQNACNQMKYRTQVYGEWGFEQRLSYGKGLSMLFAGPPGTGKTMSAEVIAADLHLEIYKIDLSQVISKYIGETEKNLHEIFTEAQLSSAILFFDEADAMFGKRSEVKDAHDKYANVETAYLLQKMEEYEGITILATNFQQNLDDAFMRRLNYVIKFPFPDSEYREKIWRGMFPKQTPIDADVDFPLLAEKCEIAGGNIKNVVLSSAFLAANEGTAVGMRHVVQALQHELKKTGKIMPKREFEDYM
ncbi:MAG: ATP-binding protein [Tumebacillaceae bacterium]